MVGRVSDMYLEGPVSIEVRLTVSALDGMSLLPMLRKNTESVHDDGK